MFYFVLSPVMTFLALSIGDDLSVTYFFCLFTHLFVTRTIIRVLRLKLMISIKPYQGESTAPYSESVLVLGGFDD
jgi:hypothetical protein